MPIGTALTGDFATALDTLAGVYATFADRTRRLAAASRAADVTVASGPEAMAIVASAWRTVEDMGGAATPFQSLALATASAGAHLRRGETPRVIVVREAGRPVVVLPTVVSRWAGLRTLRFLGDPLIQYGDALVAPDAEPHHIEAAWQAAADPSVADAIHLRRVRADANIATMLADMAPAVVEDAAPFVDLRRAHSGRLADTRALRRYQRQLARYGDVRFEMLHGEAAEPALREALALKRAWLAARGLHSRTIGNPDWENVLTTLARQDDGAILSAARVSVGERTAAVEIGLVSGRRWCAFLGAMSLEFSKGGPGNVQIAETIDHCRNDGLAVYDLLAPAQPYKLALADDSVAVRDHAVALRPSGHIAVLMARLIPHAKTLSEQMPSALRRAVRMTG